jgi:hypothetical protein
MSIPPVTKSLSMPVLSRASGATTPQPGILERIRTVFTRRRLAAEENPMNREEEENIIRILSRKELGNDGSVRWLFSNRDILYSPQGKTIHDTARFRFIAQHCGRQDLLEILDKKFGKEESDKNSASKSPLKRNSKRKIALMS